MVAPATPRLDYKPEICLARPILFAALACFERGDILGSGIRLREAVTRFVKAACGWYNCPVPPKVKRPKPVDFIRALRKAKHLDKWGADCLLEMVAAGNAAAHCGRVDRQAIKGGIGILFSFMDSEPGFCPHERQPQPQQAEIYDDGYDDGFVDEERDRADWWKEGDDEEGGDSNG